MKIRYRLLGKDAMPVERNGKGDWIDLATKERISVLSGEYHEIPLGIAMELPAGFEALVKPRSSEFRAYGMLLVDSPSAIDNSYNGDNDEWHFIAYTTRAVEIPAGMRIAQFRIQPSQFATPWQKIKWLFTSKIEFEQVSVLGNINRGGIGSTGF